MTDIMNDSVRDPFWDGAKRIMQNYNGVALDLVKEQADKKGLNGIHRFIFVACEQMRLDGLRGAFKEAALIYHAMDYNKDTPRQLLENLAYPTPSVRNDL